MIDKLKQLEQIARQHLEPTSEQRKFLTNKVLNYSENFLDNIYELPAYVMEEKKGVGIYDSPIAESGIDIDSAIKLFKENVDTPGLNPASGGHLGYIPGGGIFYSALGDFLADITNRFAGLFFASPGSVRLENMLIDWMASIIGYPKSSAGNLTSGGSIANLIGIVTARDAKNLKAKDFEKSVLYLSEQVHHSVDKAIRIAGLKECVWRYVPLDENYRMKADELEKQIVEDKKNGLNPFLVIASAGTTNTGSVDPIETIGEIASKYNLWFHLDAAYGGFFALCDEGKKVLRGMGTSDSITIDPHKGLFLPYGLGTILVKDKMKMYESHYYLASYLQDALNANDELSPADLSPELTKHFRGLRLWLPLKLVGVAPFRAAIEEKLLLARYFWEKIQTLDGFEVGPFPDLSVVMYRYIPKHGDANEFNKRLVHEVQKDGRVFISSTMIDGKFVLRVAILCFRTHLETVDLLLNILKEKAKMLEQA
ncbi:MAG: aminotransferase class I/II-fold pyridoxal phosphate-dependent enzyme [Ignavibacteriales bacterium]|nr:aminotransferase class I/II-fold pyridoxal phosphate-dependent enzyme [Ignavibacteriales bacterium]